LHRARRAPQPYHHSPCRPIPDGTDPIALGHAPPAAADGSRDRSRSTRRNRSAERNPPLWYRFGQAMCRKSLSLQGLLRGNPVIRRYRGQGWDRCRVDHHDPHRALESPEAEVAVVDEALGVPIRAGVLPHARYDHDKMPAHRRAVAERFEIPWTAISPRMQRLLYAINAIAAPANVMAAGVFCGFTFISNAAAAGGPGACYQGKNLIGVEIEARRGRSRGGERPTNRSDRHGRNHSRRRVESRRRVPRAHRPAVPRRRRHRRARKGNLSGYPPGRVGKPALRGGHPGPQQRQRRQERQPHLDFVRGGHRRASVNVVIEPEGLEASMKRPPRADRPGASERRQNCRRKRTSDSKSRRMSGMSYFRMTIRSMPSPKA